MDLKRKHDFHSRMRALTTTSKFPSEFPKCDDNGTQQFLDSLSKASDGCATSTSYNWSGFSNPSDAQRAAICKCDVDPFNVPMCSWYKEGKYNTSIATHFDYTYDCVSVNGKSRPDTKEVPLLSTLAPAPAATTAAPTTLAPTTAVPTTLPPTTAVPTTEAPSVPAVTPMTTPSAGTATAQVCTSAQQTTFYQAIFSGSASCASFDWKSVVTWSGSDEKKLCECAPLTKTSSIPNCMYEEEGGWKILLPDYLTSVIKGCQGNSSSTDKTESDSAPAPAGAGSSTPANKSSTNIGLIAGIAGGALAVVLIIALIVCKRNRKGREEPRHHHHDQDNVMNSHAMNAAMRSPANGYRPMGVTPPIAKRSNYAEPPRPSGFSDATVSTATGSVRASGTDSRGSRGTDHNNRYTDGGGKWDDPVIVAARIPRDAIFFGPVLSRGAYGEVFRGTYRGETVAIKQLLPARRKDLKQIDDFLGEVKFMSSFEHERVVSFIGVAWNSLSDACMVVEFMENGDLRSVLDRWDEGYEQRSTGFDADKIKIALHVAHALTYLHSMQPVVVHRDLKSKNILLDANFDAKVTDFGISRERAESTMTAGVGSSLWMAPEVMMGERYNEKADVFSFGVVLSELDTHQLPYFHARETEDGQKIPETAILQQVMLGRMSVRFTDGADPEIAQLGRECVNLDAKARPAAAQVLHRVHQVMQRYR